MEEAAPIRKRNLLSLIVPVFVFIAGGVYYMMRPCEACRVADTAIKTELAAFKTESAMYKSEYDSFIGFCRTQGAIERMSRINQLSKGAQCAEGAVGWAVSVKSVEHKNDYWCTDDKTALTKIGGVTSGPLCNPVPTN